jgi:hypothetical protein
VIGATTNFSFDLPPLVVHPGMTGGIGLGADNIGSVLMRAASAAALTALPFHWARRVWARRAQPRGDSAQPRADTME